jgi:hypothetical protein
MVDFDFNGKVDPLELLLTMEMISANPDSARSAAAPEEDGGAPADGDDADDVDDADADADADADDVDADADADGIVCDLNCDLCGRYLACCMDCGECPCAEECSHAFENGAEE